MADGDGGSFNDDFRELLTCLIEGEVRFVVVGAHALAAHGIVRATGDLDVLVEPSPENATRVVAALRAFGVPLAAHGVTERDFEVPGDVYQMGVPPRRIDLLTAIDGVDFGEAFASRVVVRLDGLELPVLGRDALLRNKRAADRPKDRIDVEALERRGDG